MEVNAKKETYQREDALKLLKKVTRLSVAKGKKRIDWDLKKDQPTEEEILKAILGPTGNLRAPTLIVGRTMLVGFQEEMYQEVLG